MKTVKYFFIGLGVILFFGLSPIWFLPYVLIELGKAVSDD